MRRVAAAVLAVLACASLARADLPAEITVQPGRLAALTVDTGGAAFSYEVLGDLDCFREYDPDPGKVRLRLIGYARGRHWLIVAVARKDGPPKVEKCRITVGDVPPGPDPGPKPDPPAPGPVAGLKVLIVFETADRLTPGQQAVIYGKAVRDRLDAQCAPDPARPDWKAYRIFDKDTALAGEHPYWQGLMGRPRASVPWVVVAGDAGVAFEGPLPADVPAMLALLGRFAPAKEGGR